MLEYVLDSVEILKIALALAKSKWFDFNHGSRIAALTLPNVVKHVVGSPLLTIMTLTASKIYDLITLEIVSYMDDASRTSSTRKHHKAFTYVTCRVTN